MEIYITCTQEIKESWGSGLIPYGLASVAAGIPVTQIPPWGYAAHLKDN